MAGGRVVVQQWISLDGFAAGPDGEAGLFFGVDPSSDERSQAHNDALLAGEVEVLLGRQTYEQFAAFWPTADEPIAPAVNRAAKSVASRTLDSAPWGEHAPATVVEDALAHAAAWRDRPSGLLLVWGSLDLVDSLLDAGLVDELDLFLTPVVLGAGRRLVAEGRRVELQQLEAQDWGSVTHARYAVGR